MTPTQLKTVTKEIQKCSKTPNFLGKENFELYMAPNQACNQYCIKYDMDTIKSNKNSEKGVINVLYLGMMRTHELESYYFYWERENIQES